MPQPVKKYAQIVEKLVSLGWSKTTSASASKGPVNVDLLFCRPQIHVRTYDWKDFRAVQNYLDELSGVLQELTS